MRYLWISLLMCGAAFGQYGGNVFPPPIPLIPCVGSPGATPGVLNQVCNASGTLYVCLGTVTGGRCAVAGDWAIPPASGAPPTGPASGALTGNYPSPTLANPNAANGPVVLDSSGNASLPGNLSIGNRVLTPLTGCDLTGTNDSTTCLTTAISAHPLVDLPAGTYKHTGLSITGATSLILEAGAVLTSTANPNITITGSGAAIRCLGGGGPGTGLTNIGTGDTLHIGDGTAVPRNELIDECYIDGTNTAARSIVMNQAGDVEIHGGRIAGHKDSGITITAGLHNVIRDVRLEAGVGVSGSAYAVNVGTDSNTTTTRIENTYMSAYPTGLRNAGRNTTSRGNIYEGVTTGISNIAGGDFLSDGDYFESYTNTLVSPSSFTLIASHTPNSSAFADMDISGSGVSILPRNRVLLSDFQLQGDATNLLTCWPVFTVSGSCWTVLGIPTVTSVPSDYSPASTMGDYSITMVNLTPFGDGIYQLLTISGGITGKSFTYGIWARGTPGETIFLYLGDYPGGTEVSSVVMTLAAGWKHYTGTVTFTATSSQLQFLLRNASTTDPTTIWGATLSQN